MYNNSAYIFALDGFYAFTPGDLTLKKISDFPNVRLSAPTGFLIDDNIYIGLGQSTVEGDTKEFWKYNISAGDWTRVADFPGNYKVNAYSFSITGRGYIGGGFNLIKWPYPKMNDHWEYDPKDDKWTRKQDLPSKNDALYKLVGESNDKSGYCFYDGLLYEYNTIFNIWESMATLEVSDGFCYPNIFTYGEEIFLLSVIEYRDIKYFRIWKYAQ